MDGERGPQGDHGQRGEAGPPGLVGANGIMLDRLPLTLLVIVIIAGFVWLGWRDVQLHRQVQDVQQSVTRLQQSPTPPPG